MDRKDEDNKYDENDKVKGKSDKKKIIKKSVKKKTTTTTTDGDVIDEHEETNKSMSGT